MTLAHKIVDDLLEGEEKADKPKKKLPAWLAKIKGEPVDGDDSEKEPKESKKSGSSDSTVDKTW